MWTSVAFASQLGGEASFAEGELIASGVILFFTAPSSKEQTSSSSTTAGWRIRVVPQVGPRDTGLTVNATF